MKREQWADVGEGQVLGGRSRRVSKRLTRGPVVREGQQSPPQVHKARETPSEAVLNEAVSGAASQEEFVGKGCGAVHGLELVPGKHLERSRSHAAQVYGERTERSRGF